MKSYKTTCPICHSESLYVTPNNGMSYCFRASCQYLEFNGDRVIDKPKPSDNIPEIRAIYMQLTNYYHSALGKRERDYLHARGYTDDLIQQLKIGYAPVGTLPIYKRTIAKEAGIATAKHEAFLGDRIIFPYFKDKDTVIDLRGRALDPHEELKYRSPFGGVIFRGAIFPYNHVVVPNATTLLLTESEIKAALAIKAGYDAIAIPGITAWRKGLSTNAQVIVVFDNESDPNTRKDVVKAIRTIHQHLGDFKIATLPLYKEKKAEIDTFILKYGEPLFHKVITSAIDYHTWNDLQDY